MRPYRTGMVRARNRAGSLLVTATGAMALCATAVLATGLCATGCSAGVAATTEPVAAEVAAEIQAEPASVASRVPGSHTAASHSAAAAASGESPAVPGGAEFAAPTVTERPPLPKGTTVLHIGSSSAGALGVPLKAELERRGIQHVLHHKAATLIPEWTRRKMGLDALLGIYEPDLVLIGLGGNEALLEDPTVRIDAIRRLVAKIGDRPCVWIGTPRWKVFEHTGILEVIRDHSAPCFFIDSDRLAPNLAAMGSGVHPTAAESRRWAQRVIAWLRHNRDPNGEKPWSFKTPVELPPEQ